MHDGCNYFFILGYFLPFSPLSSPENQNFLKMKKTPEDIIILHMCIKNYDQMMYRRREGGREGWTNRWTKGRREGRLDRQTDGKNNIEVGTPPKNDI